MLEPGAQLREGMEVRVEPLAETSVDANAPDEPRSLREGLMKFSGIIKGGPSDLARNHDHYLHGTPRK